MIVGMSESDRRREGNEGHEGREGHEERHFVSSEPEDSVIVSSTSDGITRDDWARVHELAIELFAALHTDAEAFHRDRLLRWLDTLEKKYGELPSIVATRADFARDGNKERLLLRAYELSLTISDRKNQLHVAHSLTQFYIEEAENAVEGRKWLDALKSHLIEIKDEHYQRDYRKFLKKLNLLPGPWTR
jgi:hypothetical protein